MKRVCKLLSIVLLLATGAWCQLNATGTITAAGTNCTLIAGACVTLAVTNATGGVVITLSGTWVGTNQFEGSGDGGTTFVPVNAYPLNSTTAASSATAASECSWPARARLCVHVRHCECQAARLDRFSVIR